MASTTVEALITRAVALLVDADYRLWTRAELLDALNDSYREIINIRPDAYSQSGVLTCVSGVRQRITADFPEAVRLLACSANVTPGGDQGRAVFHTTREALDRGDPSWRAAQPSDTVTEYAFDPVLPREFLVNPPAVEGTQIEVYYSSVPPDHTSDGGDPVPVYTPPTIQIPDSYANAMLDFMLYRAYSKDIESTDSMQRAAMYYQAFQTKLQGKTNGDAASTPKVGAE